VDENIQNRTSTPSTAIPPGFSGKKSGELLVPLLTLV